MSKVSSQVASSFKAGVAALLLGTASLALAGEPAGQLIDSPYEGVEASAVELVVSASGDVVGVRGKGCPGCPSSTLLPSDEIIVEAGGQRLAGSEINNLSGKPGVIHIYRPTGMVHRVSFTGIVFSGGGE